MTNSNKKKIDDLREKWLTPSLITFIGTVALMYASSINQNTAATNKSINSITVKIAEHEIKINDNKENIVKNENEIEKIKNKTEL